MTSEILRERAQIEQAIAGRTLCDDFAGVTGRAGGSPAYSDRPDPAAPWQTLTWAQAREQVLALAAGLADLGLAPGERVALLMPNRIEHVLADLATVHAGAVPVTFYATLSAEQIGYLAADCDARIAVVDGTDELARLDLVLAQLPGLKKIIVRDAGGCPEGERFLSFDTLAEQGRERLAASPGWSPSGWQGSRRTTR